MRSTCSSPLDPYIYRAPYLLFSDQPFLLGCHAFMLHLLHFAQTLCFFDAYPIPMGPFHIILQAYPLFRSVCRRAFSQKRPQCLILLAPCFLQVFQMLPVHKLVPYLLCTGIPFVSIDFQSGPLPQCPTLLAPCFSGQGSPFSYKPATKPFHALCLQEFRLVRSLCRLAFSQKRPQCLAGSKLRLKRETFLKEAPKKSGYLCCVRRHTLPFGQSSSRSSPIVPHLALSLLLLKKKVHSVVKRPRKRVPGLASTGILFVPVDLQTGVS
jgi:hypothetical protein